MANNGHNKCIHWFMCLLVCCVATVWSHLVLPNKTKPPSVQGWLQTCYLGIKHLCLGLISMCYSAQMYPHTVSAIGINVYSSHDSDTIELFVAHYTVVQTQMTIQCNWPLCELLLETHLVPSAECFLIQYS